MTLQMTLQMATKPIPGTYICEMKGILVTLVPHYGCRPMQDDSE